MPTLTHTRSRKGHNLVVKNKNETSNPSPSFPEVGCRCRRMWSDDTPKTTRTNVKTKVNCEKLTFNNNRHKSPATPQPGRRTNGHALDIEALQGPSVSLSQWRFHSETPSTRQRRQQFLLWCGTRCDRRFPLDDGDTLVLPFFYSLFVSCTFVIIFRFEVQTSFYGGAFLNLCVTFRRR